MSSQDATEKALPFVSLAGLLRAESLIRTFGPQATAESDALAVAAVGVIADDPQEMEGTVYALAWIGALLLEAAARAVSVNRDDLLEAVRADAARVVAQNQERKNR